MLFFLKESGTRLLKKSKKVQYRIFETNETYKCISFKNAIYLCAKCYVRYIGCPLTVSLLLLTKIYYNFMCTRSFSLSSHVHVQNVRTQKTFCKESVKKVLLLDL